jgi:hypothetical protein
MSPGHCLSQEIFVERHRRTQPSNALPDRYAEATRPVARPDGHCRHCSQAHDYGAGSTENPVPAHSSSPTRFRDRLRAAAHARQWRHTAMLVSPRSLGRSCPVAGAQYLRIEGRHRHADRTP